MNETNKIKSDSRRVSFCLADAKSYLEALRLRYDVYVGEMGRTQKAADHKRKVVLEKLDETGETYVAVKNGKVIGTFRVNTTADTDFSEHKTYDDLYNIPELEREYPGRSVVITKLMIHPEYRGGRNFLEMCKEIVRVGIRKGGKYLILDSSPNLVPAYTRFGCKQYLPVNHHPEYGDVTPMRFDLEDLDYVNEIGSPVACAFDEYEKVGNRATLIAS